MNTIFRKLFYLVLLSSIMLFPALTHAIEERVIQFRSLEDSAVTVVPVMCQNAPFYDPGHPPYTLLGARLWSLEGRAADGVVVNKEVRDVGEAYACVHITDLSPGAIAPFYMEFNVAGLWLTAAGVCIMASNHIPVGALFLVGCTLTVPQDQSHGLIGGIATSSSVFNPLSLPGFQTGSFWTVHLYFE